MENITVHKVKFTLDELCEALHIKEEIEHAYVSTYGDGFIELTLKEDDNAA